LRAGGWCVPVALGRGGVRANKREGDGGTPRGSFRPLRLWWRPDRLTLPRTILPTRRIGPADAWCEDPKDRRYNRPFRRSTIEPGDRLWRADRLYDIIIEIDHNTRPRVAGRGSAVFIHVARPGFGPTAGCVALKPRELRLLAQRLGPKSRIVIHN
jgi:L,D-peptidoglycan transpeptidase YkuD (ErfK/YbiS/YcfS/YnhG family)